MGHIGLNVEMLNLVSVEEQFWRYEFYIAVLANMRREKSTSFDKLSWYWSLLYTEYAGPKFALSTFRRVNLSISTSLIIRACEI